MKTFTIVMSLVVLTLIASCGRSAHTPWEDEDYKVYATDLDFSATRLGLDHHPGLLVLIDAEVVAAGSNNLVIVVERVDHTNNAIEFYIVTKGDSTAEGPFSKTDFEAIKVNRSLPDFSWRK